MYKNKWWLVLLSLFVLGIIAVNFYYGYVVYGKLSEPEKPKEEQKYMTIEEKAALQNQYFSRLREEIEKEIETSKGNGRIAVAYYDIETQTDIQINQNELFTGASTIKLPLTMLVADKFQSGELSPDAEVWYLQTDYEGGTGKIQENVQPSYTISELIDFALKNSDNIAANMLRRQVGGSSAAIKQIGEKYLNEPNIDPEKNEISANRGMLYLKSLYLNPDPPPYYENIINDLKDSEFKEQLYTDKTKDIVAHKVGSGETIVHDMGIFETPHPYLLIVCTDQVEKADSVISTISDIVYDEQTKNYPDKDPDSLLIETERKK